MKTLCILFFALVAFPASLLAGVEHEQRSLPHAAEMASPHGVAEPILSETMAMERPLSSIPGIEATPRVEPQSPKVEVTKSTKVMRPTKPHRAAWARTGTIILLISAGVFLLGLIFLVIGIASFYGFGLVLLGEIFLLLSSIGLTVGLIVGALG